ncbi:MAG: DUF72 domain-containing protein, partial [Calditrichaeota bacterium]
NKGCVLCLAETENDSSPGLIRTADWGYLRLRKPDYDDTALANWLTAIKAQEWNEVYVFFKHEDEGAGPRLAARFLELAKA